MAKYLQKGKKEAQDHHLHNGKRWMDGIFSSLNTNILVRFGCTKTTKPGLLK